MNVISILNTIWKNRKIGIYILAGIFLLLYLHQCNRTQNFKEEVKKQKIDKKRIRNNFEAAKDTVENLKVNDSVLQGKIQGYKLKLNELKSEHSELLENYEDLKERPRSIVKKEIIIKDSMEGEIDNEMTSDTTGILKVNSDTVFNEGNSRSLSMRAPYSITSYTDGTSGINNKVLFDVADIELEQKMSLTTGIFEEPETGKIKIRVNTKYPGVKFTKIKGAEITGDEVPEKLSRKFRKRFGIGFHVGYGYTYARDDIMRGPQVGINISYTPKFLQF